MPSDHFSIVTPTRLTVFTLCKSVAIYTFTLNVVLNAVDKQVLAVGASNFFLLRCPVRLRKVQSLQLHTQRHMILAATHWRCYVLINQGQSQWSLDGQINTAL